MTGEKGFNLAAVMLLGKDDVIADIVPLDGTATQVTQAQHLDNEQKIISLLQQNDNFASRSGCKTWDKFSSTVKYYVRKLRELGHLERIGSSQKGKWIIKS